MTSIAEHISVTGAIVALVLYVVMPESCPRRAVAVPFLVLYFAAVAAAVGGYLWWVWAP